jgi:type II secretory pathway component GspD/PulD (secretin)
MLILALMVWCGITRGQDAPPTDAAPAAPVTAPTSGPAYDTQFAEAPAPSASTNTVNSTNQPVQNSTNAVQEPSASAVSSINQPVQNPAGAVQEQSTNVVASETVDITLQPDVTLPNAVQMLARMAKINFQFDPQILNERVDEKGAPIPVPVIGTEIRWEGVTAAQALNALLENNNWQMIADSRTGIARITRRDPKAVEVMATKVIQLHYSNATNLFGQLTNMVARLAPGCMIIPDMRTSQMVIVAPERHVATVESLIQKLDTRTKQVLIEARLIETTRNPTSVKGIDWSKTLDSQHVSFGNGFTTGTSATTANSVGGNSVRGDGTTLPGSTVNTVNQNSTMTTTVGSSGAPSSSATSPTGVTMDTLKGFNPATAFLNADGVQAVLSFINSDTESEQMNLPRTVAQDGVETQLEVIQNIPVFEQNQSAGAAGSQALTTVKPNYNETVGDTIINEVGVKLQVTPRIVGQTNVFLTLHPEVSDQDPVVASFQLNGQTSTSPMFNRRKITTQATVPSGYTLVLGGLNHDFTSTAYTKVPVLGDIPGIGLLFRHESKSRTKQNLMIFVTPTIVEDSDYQPTKTEFLKNRFVDKPDVPEGAWDSAKPKDWTKPKAGVEPAYSPVAQ